MEQLQPQTLSLLETAIPIVVGIAVSHTAGAEHLVTVGEVRPQHHVPRPVIGTIPVLARLDIGTLAASAVAEIEAQEATRKAAQIDAAKQAAIAALKRAIGAPAAPNASAPNASAPHGSAPAGATAIAACDAADIADLAEAVTVVADNTAVGRHAAVRRVGATASGCKRSVTVNPVTSRWRSCRLPPPHRVKISSRAAVRSVPCAVARFLARLVSVEATRLNGTTLGARA